MRSREEEQERAEWERIRWLAAVLLSPHARKGKTIQPRDLAVFPWEKQERTTQDNEAAAQRRAELFAKWDEEMKIRHGHTG